MQRKPAESIERCVLLDPEQGSIEDLRILETTHGNPGRISEVSVSLQTKDLYSRRKTIKSSMSLPYSDLNKKRMKVRSVHEDTLNEIQNSNASDIIENRYLAYFNRPAGSGDINLSASSNNYNYYQPLLTIHE